MEQAEFDRVWQRVRGSGEESEEARLRREIGEAEKLLEIYAALTPRWREGERYRREKAEELRTLRGEYFLLTGERCGEGRGGGTLLLRQALAGEERAAEEYLSCAEGEASLRRRVYERLGREAARRAELLRKAIMNTVK